MPELRCGFKAIILYITAKQLSNYYVNQIRKIKMSIKGNILLILCLATESINSNSRYLVVIVVLYDVATSYLSTDLFIIIVGQKQAS